MLRPLVAATNCARVVKANGLDIEARRLSLTMRPTSMAVPDNLPRSGEARQRGFAKQLYGFEARGLAARAARPPCRTGAAIDFGLVSPVRSPRLKAPQNRFQ